MYNRERRSHAQGVYSTQDTKRIAKVKQEEDTRIKTKRVARNLKEMNVGTKGKCPKQA